MDLGHLVLLAQLKHDRDQSVLLKLQQRQNDLQRAITTLDSTAQTIDATMRLAQRDGVWRMWALDKSRQLKQHLAQCLAAQEHQKSRHRSSAARLDAIPKMHDAEQIAQRKKRQRRGQDQAIETVVIQSGYKS